MSSTAAARQNSLDDALISESIKSKKGFLQFAFSKWFDAFVYNQIWEDPEVDIEALEINENSRILTISSGGCNALNYLVCKPQHITAVDLNRYHIYLLRTKIAAIKSLPGYGEFFELFGNGGSVNSESVYFRWIRPDLDRETRRFWESNSLPEWLVLGNRIAYFRQGGLYKHSRNGYFLRFFLAFAHLIGCRPEKLLKAKTPDEQSEVFKSEIEPFFDNFIIRQLAKLPLTLFGLGIPPQQFQELLAENETNLIETYRERVRRLACDFPISTNYFAWQAFGLRYNTESQAALPSYLREENFVLLKTQINKIETEICSITDIIEKSGKGAFNRFVFLDAQDWMSKEQLERLWNAIATNGEKGSKIIFRTAGMSSPIERQLSEKIRSKFNYKEQLSKVLAKKDRASIYGGFHLYELK
ncbi:MAG TPA: BtaA family protein [Pyrinomonadaceae bacterium]|nr:BtaA family protein [Pyrinomonadaceae bacterium]